MNKFIFRSTLAIFSALSFALVSCDDDDNKLIIDPVEKFALGAYILNEGSFFSGVNGSLSRIDYGDNTFTDSLFVRANGRTLGGTPNDAVINGTKMYIAVSAENRIEVVNAETLKSLGFIEQHQPRKLAVYSGKVYASSYEGTVISIDTTSLKKVGTSEVVGSCLEGITAMNGSLYVCNAYNSDYTYNTNVVELNASTLAKVKDFTVALNPTRIANDGTNIYVQSTGNYYDVPASIQSIDVKNGSVKELCSGTYMTILNNKIYSINSVYGQPAEYNVYDIATGEISKFIDGSDIYSPCAIAADPTLNIIYISSYNEGAFGSADYASKGYIVSYTEEGTKIYKYNAGVGPTTYVFLTK